MAIAKGPSLKGIVGTIAICVFVLPPFAKGVWSTLSASSDESHTTAPSTDAAKTGIRSEPVTVFPVTIVQQAPKTTPATEIKKTDQNQITPSNGEVVITTPPVAAASRIFTDEEIEKIEREQKYDGSDPIVRARLGIPSRETHKLIENVGTSGERQPY